MNKRKLGRTNLHLSELGLNTAKLDWSSDEAASFALLDTYYSCGGSFLQSFGLSPDSVAARLIENTSEDLVGRWRQSRAINRDNLVLASRVQFVRPAFGGTSAFANVIREACEQSLRRLRTKHLDLLICDWDNRLTPVDDVVEAIDRLIRAGLVRHAVAGGFPPWRVVDSVHRSGLRNQARFEALQAEYSLLTRVRFEPEALAMCKEHRLGFIARSPLAGGLLAQPPDLSRTLTSIDGDSGAGHAARTVEEDVLKVLGEVADQRLATPAQIALAWVLRNPQVTSAVISAPDPRGLRELVRSADIILTTEEVGSLANASMSPSRRVAPSLA